MRIQEVEVEKVHKFKCFGSMVQNTRKCGKEEKKQCRQGEGDGEQCQEGFVTKKLQQNSKEVLQEGSETSTVVVWRRGRTGFGTSTSEGQQRSAILETELGGGAD